MAAGRKAKSSLSKTVTRYRPRASSDDEDENTPPTRSGRSTQSMASAVKQHDEHQDKRRKTLQDLAQKGHTEPENVSDPNHDDDEWEDLPFDFDLAEALAGFAPNEDVPASVDRATGAFVASAVPHRARVDTRTRADQIKNQESAWAAVMPQLIDAYLAWKHRVSLAQEPDEPQPVPHDDPESTEPANVAQNALGRSQATSDAARRTQFDSGAVEPAADIPETADPIAGAHDAAAAPTAPQTQHWFTVAALCDTGFERYLRIEQPASEHASVSLMRVGMMACTPLIPGVAISIGILKMYYHLRRRAPRLGVQPFVRALCDRHNCQYRPYLREQFTAAFDTYLAMLRELERRVDGALGHDAPNWRALNACAPCNYELEGEEHLVIGGLVAMDGGQSPRRNATAGVADQRIFESDYRIAPEEVDLYANEVQRRIVPKKVSKRQAQELEAPAYKTLNESGEPGDDAPRPSVCASRWKNAKAEHFKLAPGMFDQTGVFVCLCRHGLVLWFVEMIRSGELAKYPLAVIARMIRAGFRKRRNGYDIGCAFQGTVERSELLGSQARDAEISTGVNAFHGYGHNRLCQLGGHPLYEDGFGLEDLETCERFFSWLNGVAAVVRHASHYHWVQYIDLAIRQWDEDKYSEISRFLYNNVKQAKLLQSEFSPLVATFKTSSGMTDADIEGWRVAEREYLEGLQTEPEEVALRMDYVAMLADLESATAMLSSKQADFADGVRAPSEEEIAAMRLSPAAVKKLYKARVDAYDRYTKTRDAVVALEAVLDIDERWSTVSSQYRDALVQMAERDWRKALDRLELLMVQRMFELAKSHIFGTGYKLREAISKGLKSRSQAIRTAVTRYNDLAAALVPPAPSVDFATLMEWTELQEFELLRHSRSGDIREKVWAQPAHRLMAIKHYKLVRAEEELTRCRIEARRLVTAMWDEERHMDSVYDSLLVHNRPLAFELYERMVRRKATNALHRARLSKLTVFEEFRDCLVPGVRKGHAIEAREGVPTAPTSTYATSENVEDITDDLDAPDDAEEEELHLLHDFLAAVE